MLVGGVLGTTVDESDMRIGPCGYIDPFYSYNGPGTNRVIFFYFIEYFFLSLMK